MVIIHAHLKFQGWGQTSNLMEKFTLIKLIGFILFLFS